MAEVVEMSSNHHVLATCGNSGPGIDVELMILSENPAVLQVKIGSSAVRDFSGVDLFECLLAVRVELESQGLLLCCQGARKNVSPSGMTRQMSNGRLAYVLPAKGAVSDDDLVDVFAPAACVDVASIDDQKAEISRIFFGH